MFIIASATAVQRSRQHYGASAAEFSPERWDASNESSYLAKNRGQQGLMASGLDYPTIHRPARGSFLAFSDGRRQCLGKKFAQVLFTATMAIVLRSWEVDLVLEKGETRGMAENRARRALEGSWAATTLQVREDVGLVLRRRA